MSESIRDTIQSIMVALDNSRRRGLALETAARLAAELQAELRGLFVEDEDLFRLAAMPFACEIGGTTASPRPLHLEVIERTFRVKAEEAKQALMATAQRLQVQWSFQVRRGQLLQTTFAAAEEADLTIVEPPSPTIVDVLSTRRSNQRLTTTGRLPSAQRSERQTSILVIVDGSNSAFRALRIALYLSRHVIADLTICLAPVVTSNLEELRNLTSEIVKDESLPGGVEIAFVSTKEPMSAKPGVRKTGFQLALLSLENLASDEPQMRNFIQQLRCPLALVR